MDERFLRSEGVLRSGRVLHLCPEHAPKPNPHLAELGANFFVGRLVKTAFGDPGSSRLEHMWVSITRVEDGKLVGTLANVPERIESVKYGDSVTVGLDKIEMFREHGDPVGLVKETLDRITVGGCACKSPTCTKGGPLYMRQRCHPVPTDIQYDANNHILSIRCMMCKEMMGNFYVLESPPLHCPACETGDMPLDRGMVWIKYRNGSGVLESECMECGTTLGGGRMISMPEIIQEQ